MGKKNRNQSKKKGKSKFDEVSGKRKGRGKGQTKPPKGWMKHLNDFQDTIKEYGVQIRDVAGDGNCLFRSISDHLEGSEDSHKKYRDLAVDYLTKRKSHFGLFLEEDENIDDYLKDMSEDGTWGGHFELIALSAVLNVKFCIYLKDEEPMLVRAPSKISGS